VTALSDSAESILRRAVYGFVSPRTVQRVAEPFFVLAGRRSHAALDLSQVQRVLVVRLDEIGDIVMMSAFLRELRRQLPQAYIALMVKPSVYPLLELCPYVDATLVYRWVIRRYVGHLQRLWDILRLAQRELWPRQFDLTITPRWDADLYHADFVAYFSGAPWRVGYAERLPMPGWERMRGADILFTHVVTDETVRHEIERSLEIIRFLGRTVADDKLELWLSAQDEALAAELLARHGAQATDVLIALCPGAGAPKRWWPIERFSELAWWLQQTVPRVRLVVIGGPGEERLGQTLEQRLGETVINAVGRTTLRQTAALLKHCCLYVGSDSGPMHMAAALGKPVVEISCHPQDGAPSHANSPLRFGPWRVPQRVLQPTHALPPCQDGCDALEPHCILDITVAHVQQAILDLKPEWNPCP
jgi:heptosyltransferase-2